MTKAELTTPEKEIDRKLFHDQGQFSQQSEQPGQSSQQGQSSQPHSQNATPGGISTPPNSHSQNDKGGTDCVALKETVRRLSFWILQITGALDVEEDPGKVSFPNPKTCRELDKLKKDGSLAGKVPGVPFQESRGRSIQNSHTGRGSGFTQTRAHSNCRSNRSGFESPTEGSCKDSGNTAGLGYDQGRVHLQQPQLYVEFERIKMSRRSRISPCHY